MKTGGGGRLPWLAPEVVTRSPTSWQKWLPLLGWCTIGCYRHYLQKPEQRENKFRVKESVR